MGRKSCAPKTGFLLFLHPVVGFLKVFLMGLFGLSCFFLQTGGGAGKKPASGKLSLSEKAGEAVFFSAFAPGGLLFSFESSASPLEESALSAKSAGGQDSGKKSPPDGEDTAVSEAPSENRLPKGWRKADLFSGEGGRRLFISDRAPEIIASVSKTLRRGAPLPETEQDFQIQEEQKRRTLQKIPGLSQWTPEFYSWDPKDKTLFLKGFLIRQGKKIFFKEQHFYYETHIIQILMESSEYFPDNDRRVVRFLKYIRQGSDKGDL